MKNSWTSQWQDVIQQLQNQLPSQQFDAWIHPLEAKQVDNDIFISCASNFFINGLKADCGSVLEQCIQSVFGKQTNIRYEVGLPNIHTHKKEKEKKN